VSNVLQELTHLLSSLNLSESLPYMGNTDGLKDLSHTGETELNNNKKSENDLIKKPGEKQTHDQTSYLNLSPNKGRPTPIKRSVF